MKIGVCIAAVALAIAGVTAQAAEPDQCRNVRLGEVSWTDVAVTTGTASVLFKGLGYKPDTLLGSIPIVLNGMAQDQRDIFLGYWSPTMDSMTRPLIEKSQIHVLKTPNLTGAKYTLAVPEYAYKAGLRSFQDIARYADKLDHKIYGIEPGNDGNDLILDMINDDRFGLDDFRLVASSEAGMLVALRRAVSKKRWMVFLGWAPHPMNFNFDIKYLDGGEDVCGPDHGAAKVYTIVANGYLDKCPNAGRLVRNLQFDVDMENEMMNAVMNGARPEEAATAWLQKNPKVLDKWLAGVHTFDGGDGLAAVKAYLKK